LTGDDDLFLKKHLARNVPLDFMACCERVRIRLTTDGQRHRRTELKLERVYPDVPHTICTTEMTGETEKRILLGLIEIEVRYLALSKTVDHSVPAEPIYQNLRMLRGRLRTAADRLDDPDRDAAVRYVGGLSEEDPIPAGIEAFRASQSISERAARAKSTLNAMAAEIDEMVSYFDYKYPLTRRPSGTDSPPHMGL
jgi:hypothetical protein